MSLSHWRCLYNVSERLPNVFGRNHAGDASPRLASLITTPQCHSAQAPRPLRFSIAHLFRPPLHTSCLSRNSPLIKLCGSVRQTIAVYEVSSESDRRHGTVLSFVDGTRSNHQFVSYRISSGAHKLCRRVSEGPLQRYVRSGATMRGDWRNDMSIYLVTSVAYMLMTLPLFQALGRLPGR